MNVEVKCQVCSKNGNIDINQKEMNDIERGIMSISIAQNFVCIHSFLVHIDKNFKVRDSH
ncbi:MAG: hypothetical protein ACFFBP_17130 [Promethearchaeota archaeon]